MVKTKKAKAKPTFNGKWFDEDFYRGGTGKGAKRDQESPFYQQFVNRVIQTYDPIDSHKEQRVLDVGCGMGYRTAIYLQNGFDVIGVDVSQWAFDNSVLPPGRQVCADARDLGKFFEPEEFDLVVAERVLGYIPKEDAIDVVKILAGLSNGAVLFSIICSDHISAQVRANGAPGRINMAKKAFWIDAFDRAGLEINEAKTIIMRQGGWDCVWWCDKR